MLQQDLFYFEMNFLFLIDETNIFYGSFFQFFRNKIQLKKRLTVSWVLSRKREVRVT